VVRGPEAPESWWFDVISPTGGRQGLDCLSPHFGSQCTLGLGSLPIAYLAGGRWYRTCPSASREQLETD